MKKVFTEEALTFEVDETIKHAWIVVNSWEFLSHVPVYRDGRLVKEITHESQIPADWDEEVKASVRKIVEANRPLAEDEFRHPGSKRRVKMRFAGGRFEWQNADGGWYVENRFGLQRSADDRPDPDGWPRALAYFDRHRPLATNEERKGQIIPPPWPQGVAELQLLEQSSTLDDQRDVIRMELWTQVYTSELARGLSSAAHERADQAVEAFSARFPAGDSTEGADG